MRRRLWSVGTLAVLSTFLLAVMRLRKGALLDRVRVFNRRILNPVMARLAGRRYWYASLIRHQGRRSGREYVTPVVATPAEDSFVIPLPYGEGVDWLKNVLAAGGATIEAKGKTCAVVEPEVMGAADAFPLLDERRRRTWRLFGIERFLMVKRLPEGTQMTAPS
jgi:deazaflavin-dependent oxidoreductase (nitroreductase family)